MSGAFPHWQPRYAEHGIATFPVWPDKKPAVRGHLKAGTRASTQFALKFPDFDCFGFACKRSDITVLDVDTPDERVLADALSEYGDTPIIVRSGSGNWQAWFKHNGERRRVRPDPRKPIDVLGDGIVVAPPSVANKGPYSFVAGSLDDLDHLPVMRPGKPPLIAPEASPASPQQPKAIEYAGPSVGERNENFLFPECRRLAAQCDTLDQLFAAATHFNASFAVPLDNAEVAKTVASAWKYKMEGRLLVPGSGQIVTVSHDVVDRLAATDPYAFALLGILRRYHWGREFALSKSMAESLGWTLPRFKEARTTLAETGLIRCIHAGGRGKHDPPVYRLT